MPNWVYNGLTIEGDPSQVKALMAQMNKPFTQEHDSWNVKTNAMEKEVIVYSNPVFAFRNIYSHLDHGVTDDEYNSQPPAKSADLSFADFLKFESNDWYNFNCREWGVKWDVAVSDENSYSNTYFEESENGENYVVFYNFETAWARPVSALEKLSAQYPNLLMTLNYEEETGWGGEMEFLRGGIISDNFWESKCRNCDEIDCLEYCDNGCGEICLSCNWTPDLDAESAEKCQTHMVLLNSTEGAE
jgi:hypothetical protein